MTIIYVMSLKKLMKSNQITLKYQQQYSTSYFSKQKEKLRVILCCKAKFRL